MDVWRRRVGLALVMCVAAVGGLAIPAWAAPTETELDALRDKLIWSAPVGSGARVDLASGKVVLRIPGQAPASLAATLSRYGDLVRVVPTAPIQPLSELVGGLGIEGSYGPHEHCTSGFMVTDGVSNFVVTAGHCTRTSTRWERKHDYLGDRYQQHVYGPEGDYGVILVKGVTFEPRPQVFTGVAGANSWLLDAAEPVVGQQLCKMGNKTKLTCGTVLNVNASSHLSWGVMEGLIETDICAGVGDSGSPLFTPPGGEINVAYGYGIVANGNSDCSAGNAVTYFQPLPEILDHYGLQVGVTIG